MYRQFLYVQKCDFLNGRTNKQVNAAETQSGNKKKAFDIPVRLSKAMARRPLIYLITAVVSTIVLSGCGIYFGGFETDIENDGWITRGTIISNRQVQVNPVERNKQALYGENKRFIASRWDTLQNKNMPRRLSFDPSFSIAGCGDISNVLAKTFHENLVVVWRLDPKSTSSSQSILDPEILHEICEAEERNLALLEKHQFCYKCDNDCLPPLSIILESFYWNARINLRRACGFL